MVGGISRRWRFLVVVVAVGLAACATTPVTTGASSAGSAVHTRQGGGLFGGEPVRLADCATTDFSVLLKGEVNTAYDTVSRVLELSALGPDAVDVHFWVSVDDPVCQAVPALGKQIASAISEAA
jgi:hypothetical protein